MDTNPDLKALALGATGVAALYLLIRNAFSGPKLDSVPVVGPSGSISSYIGAFRYVFHAKEMFQEGYEQYPSAMFRVAVVDRWSVLVSGKQLVEDIASAREEDLSFHQSTNEFLQTRYTLGRGCERDPYHPAVIRTSLTRNVGHRFPDVRDEILQSFNDLVPVQGEDWLEIPGYDTMLQVICRTSNRFFVGLPLCRDPDYLALMNSVAMDVVVKAQLINFLPAFLRPTLGPLIASLNSNMRRAGKHLTPLVAERLKKMEEVGSKDWPGKPNDLISWLMDSAQGEELTLNALVQRVIFVNFAAIRTSTDTFVHLLFDLAAEPSFVQPLREEVETIVNEEGWTRASVGKMFKIDSFLRESQRMHGIGTQSLGRKIVKPGGFTFSDGTTLPSGTYLHATTWSLHHDPELYPDPHVLDPFRFDKLRQAEEVGAAKYQAVTTSLDYLAFGHGVHACPGRHMAVIELKAIIAHIVLNYDIKLPNNEGRPANQYVASACLPHATAKVLFRKRQS
ncbi:cytochrome P450 [Mycena alexandri]|uniref:Cytochrome P450 n=1 Tax=Mycena alexandri TaxID=1745969 RepID=A0AAD6X2H7_9AGAR|nr:cytochrome P450 [Mycena alexandri]